MTLFNSLFDLPRGNMLLGSGAQRTFLPPADVIVGEDGVTVTMDVPGLNADSLEIELTDEVLAVRGERGYPELNGETTKWYRIERGYGKFQRILQVPKGLDPDAVTASITDGVLTIHVPLPEARKPRRIQIANGHQQAAIESDTTWQEFNAQTSENAPVEEEALVGAAS